MIGVIGIGFVGKSVINSIKNSDMILTYDRYKKSGSLLRITEKASIAFICTPTPTINCVQDTSSIIETLKEMENFNGLIVIKSTIMPGSLKQIIDNYDLNIIHVPEFLNEHDPFKKPEFYIIGTNEIRFVNEYLSILKDPPQHMITDPVTASFIKYVHNCYGALKVTFFNEIYDICQANNVNYRTLLNGLFSINNNIGRQYTQIAADGKRGFGGHCFPKDVVAFHSEYKNKTLGATIMKNLDYRKEEMEKVIQPVCAS